jgi:hypothetical protein
MVYARLRGRVKSSEWELDVVLTASQKQLVYLRIGAFNGIGKAMGVWETENACT